MWDRSWGGEYEIFFYYPPSKRCGAPDESVAPFQRSMKMLFIYERYTEYIYVSGISDIDGIYTHNINTPIDRNTYSFEEYPTYFRANENLIGIGILMLCVVGVRVWTSGSFVASTHETIGILSMTSVQTSNVETLRFVTVGLIQMVQLGFVIFMVRWESYVFRVLNHSGQKHLPGISVWISDIYFCIFRNNDELARIPKNASYQFFRYVFGSCKTDFDLEVAVRVWRV